MASLLLPKNPIPGLGLLGLVAIIPAFSDSSNIHNKNRKRKRKEGRR